MNVATLPDLLVTLLLAGIVGLSILAATALLEARRATRNAKDITP